MSKDYLIYFDNQKLFITEEFKDCLPGDYGIFLRSEWIVGDANVPTFFQTLSSVRNLCIFGCNTKEIFRKLQSNFKFIAAAGGLVRNVNGDVLLIMRNGKWDLPKGKEDAGESSEQTAMREVSEECGIQGPSISWHVTDTYHTYLENEVWCMKKTVWYYMEFCGTGVLTPQVAENITEVRWVPASELHSYMDNTYPSIRDVIRLAGLLNVPSGA